MSAQRMLRIGVDVGGTNTDAVILDLTPNTSSPVLASFKSPTTPDVTLGISRAISGCLSRSSTDKADIQAIAIGTTSFVNSLVERDARKLQKVGVIRLCGPHSRLCAPFVSFPYELRNVVEGPVWMVEGGLQVDGREISKLDENEILRVAAELKKRDIKTVAVSGVYSPIDHDHRQEERVREILLAEIPGIRVTISKEVANIGILERENATILNASLLSFAHVAVAGFRASLKELDLTCPLFLTSNDGTLMTCEQAEQFPIKTFSSGPTNSMRGANFLAGLASGGARKETALVIDVGGTTTEVGVLLPTGFPRQAGARHELCGVALNFSMPHVHSFGLGGGSRVRVDDQGKVTVGPDSVGYKIEESLSFGGQTLTTTDIVVAAGRAPGVGDASLVAGVDKKLIEEARERMKTMIELALDSMKTSTQDVPAYLVGGGAILAPDTLKGISKVHRFPFFDAANAVGAACAQVSGVIDTFEDTSLKSLADVRKEVEKRAIDKAVAAGSDPKKTEIVESEVIPIAYTTGRARFYVKAAGPWTGMPITNGHSKPVVANGLTNGHTKSKSNGFKPYPPANIRTTPLPEKDIEVTAATILEYKPTITPAREWLLSELDLEWIATGCYIMGCGGGGSPYSKFLALREIVREGGNIKVIDLREMEEDGKCIWGGGIGSPEVSQERLVNLEYNEAVAELMKFLNMDKCASLAALEIGGGNGMISMVVGASKYMDIPTLDGDFMGRAYPTGWQTTPNVYDYSGRGEMMLPCSQSSGDGNVIFLTKAKTDKEVDSILRAACVETGTHAGSACRPLTKAECQQALIKNTVSQSWHLGRAVALATKQSRIGNIGRILVDAMGGEKTAKVLFAGKIVDLHRKIWKGHTYGEIVIQALRADEEEDDDPENPRQKFEGIMKIPFKNENLLCEHTVNGVTKVTASVPDLISVLDSQTGHALGTPDYKYGLRVMVLGITAAPQWTDTPRGLELGALPAFGYDGIPYEPIGVYVKPASVIDEYGPKRA